MLGIVSQIAGPFASRGLQYLGQREANQTNRDIAAQANAFNDKEAEEQRYWQQRMSNTAHQRAVNDLKEAGLNPLLAATNGASTPGGGQASAAMTSVENELGAAVTSAMEARRVSMEMKKGQQELENMKSTNDLLKSQKNKTDVDAKVASKEIPKADVINRVYKIAEPILKKIESATQTSGKPLIKGLPNTIP